MKDDLTDSVFVAEKTTRVRRLVQTKLVTKLVCQKKSTSTNRKPTEKVKKN